MKINNSNPRTAKGVNGTKEGREVFESTFKDSSSNDVQTKDLTSYKSAVESAEAKVTSAEQNLASAQAIRDNTSPTIEKQFQIGVDENNNPIYETRQEPNPDYKAAQDAVAAAEGELSTAKEEKTQAEAEQTKAQEEYEKTEKENEETQEALNTAKDEISAESDSEFDEYTQCSYSTEEEFYLPQENDNQYSASIHIFADIINDADKENFYEILNNESLTSEDWANIIQDYNQNYANRNENKTFVNALYTNLSKTTEKSELNNIMDTVAMKLTEAADNDNPIAQDAIREMDSNGYINLASNTDISELKEIAEEIPQLDIEQYSSPEDQNKAWAINDLINTLNSSMNNILEQDKEDGAISDGYNFIKEITGCGVSIEDIKKAIVSQKETVQKLTDALNGKGEKSFEETYKELTGTTYDDQKIIEYKDAEINYNMAYKSLNNAYSLCDLVKNCNSYNDLLETYKNFYGSEEEARKEISDILLDGYKAAHAESVEIDENNKIHIKYRDGKEQDYDSLTQEQLSLIYITIDSNKTEYQNKYSQVELEAIENYFGKSYEEIQKDYVEKENNALGNANAIEQTVNKYCEDQDGFIDNIAHKTQLAGMCLLVGGAVVSFVCPPAGAAMGAAMMSVGKGLSFGGMFGNQVAKIINNGTSEKGITKEDVSGLLKETVQELSYIALGCGINHIAETLQVQSFDGLIEMGVSEKTATVLSWLVEGGTDMALSIMSDLVITGDANFNGNSMQVLMGILTGVANAKANSYRADMAADSKIKDIRSELGDISESDANAEVLRRFGYNDSEIAEMASKPSTEVDKAIIRERKIRAYSNVLEEQGVDTSKMSAQEKLSKGAIADGLLKNIDNVKQEGDDGSCAIAAVLNGIVGKGKNAIDRLSQKFTYDEASDKYSCAELGIEGIEVDIAGGENAALKIYEAFKASNPDLSEGTCVTKVLNVLMDGGNDIIAKFDGNIESIKNYANDSDTILTLNTEKGVDVQSADGKITTIKEGHAYTVSGYNSTTRELILIDPQNPNSVIKIQESDFNKLIESDAQIEGKTYADGDSGIVDTEARIVGGTDDSNAEQVIDNGINSGKLKVDNIEAVKKLIMDCKKPLDVYNKLVDIGDNNANLILSWGSSDILNKLTDMSTDDINKIMNLESSNGKLQSNNPNMIKKHLFSCNDPLAALDKLSGYDPDTVITNQAIDPQKIAGLKSHDLHITTIRDKGVDGFHVKEGYQEILSVAMENDGPIDITQTILKYVDDKYKGNYSDVTISAEYIGTSADGNPIVKLTKSQPGATDVEIKMEYGADDIIDFEVTKGKKTKTGTKTLAPQEDIEYVIDKLSEGNIPVSRATQDGSVKGFAVKYNGRYYIGQIGNNGLINSVYPISETALIRNGFVIDLVPNIW